MPVDLTDAGLQVKSRGEIRSDIVTRLLASPTLGPGLRTTSSGAINDLINVIVEQLGQLHEATLDVYQAFNAQSAEGASLDNLSELVFVSRLPATRSTGTATLTGTPGVIVPGGTRIRIPNGPEFRLISDAEIGGGGTVDTLIESVDTGPIEAGAGTITEIVDAVAGWASVTNAEAVTPGSDQQTDEELRRTRAQSEQTGRAGTDNSIRTALERGVTNILSVLVISNRTNAVDANGIADHSTRAVLYPDTVDTDEVAEILWRQWPAGIGFDGAESVIITDDQGFPQEVRWSWATEIDIYLEIDVLTTAAIFPADGEDQVRAAVDTYALELGTGDDVLPLEIQCLVAQISGVRSVVVRVGVAPSPVSTAPYPIEITEIASLDSAAPRTVVAIT